MPSSRPSPKLRCMLRSALGVSKLSSNTATNTPENTPCPTSEWLFGNEDISNQPTIHIRDKNSLSATPFQQVGSEGRSKIRSRARSQARRLLIARRMRRREYKSFRLSVFGPGCTRLKKFLGCSLKTCLCPSRIQSVSSYPTPISYVEAAMLKGRERSRADLQTLLKWAHWIDKRIADGRPAEKHAVDEYQRFVKHLYIWWGAVSERASFIIDIISDAYGHKSNANAWQETISVCPSVWWHFGFVATMVENFVLKRDEITGPPFTTDLACEQILYIKRDARIDLTYHEELCLHNDDTVHGGRAVTDEEERYQHPWKSPRFTAAEIGGYFINSWKMLEEAILKDTKKIVNDELAVSFDSLMTGIIENAEDFKTTGPNTKSLKDRLENGTLLWKDFKGTFGMREISPSYVPLSTAGLGKMQPSANESGPSSMLNAMKGCEET